MTRKVLAALIAVLSIGNLKADEGMWLPQLLQQLNAAEMRLKGLQIPAEEIYSVNKNSLKDAVVLFGGGCTGEIISSKGLLLTNHHCGYGQIQEHSSLEHNYLRDGFWAMSMKEELPCPGLTATFIIRIDDVTASFSKALEELTEAQRADKIKEISAQLEKKAAEGTHYEARVRQFYSGNEFYLILTETFKDVRLVGAPPSSIGKFGGDTDNWMWPRHTGDFSMFRVYAGKDNKPADYSASNVPFTPRHFFSISTKGVQPEDFTMVYGFPGRTQQYISSYQLGTILEVTNPNRIGIRSERLQIMDEAMRSSEALHLKYAAKQSGVSNAWKKWKGESRGLTAANGLQRKRDFETDFRAWCGKSEERNKRYGSILPALEKLYAATRPYLAANDYYAEAALGIEIMSYAVGYKNLVDLAAAEKADTAKIRKETEQLKAGLVDYFKDYDAATDLKMTGSLLRLFDRGVADSLKPAYFTALRQRYQSDFGKMAEALFKDSRLDEFPEMEALLKKPWKSQAKALKKDAAYRLSEELITFYRSRVADKITAFNTELNRLNRLYLAAQRDMQPDRKFYPDANSTLRLAYGQVRGYEARDAVYFGFNTTLDGMMEKYIPGDEEFDLPARLVELYQKKDYGPYAVNGTVPVAFIATNHTTGGNSGSPVLNAKGQLIGTNYDRVWEGTMSDILFNPEICRNVSLDIRYTLFIVDKFAGAGHLLEEMDVVN
ncbi:MAG: S46 family peptidase [Bacteroidia bacterium]|nr:S46 family peptidase [Bacteroidia bacterium]